MSQAATPFLDDDGSASLATGVLMTHHGLRRELALFSRALREPRRDAAGVEALREEWKFFHQILHGHHDAEDTRMFPHLKNEHGELAEVIEQLGAQHRQIDPLLAQGDEAFARLPDPAPAAALVAELSSLLDTHLALEEANIIRHLRPMKQFPPPASDEELALYSQGFAWGSRGISPRVLAALDAMIPEAVRSKLPAARAAYEERCRRVWGEGVGAGASLSSVPDWLLRG